MGLTFSFLGGCGRIIPQHSWICVLSLSQGWGSWSIRLHQCFFLFSIFSPVAFTSYKSCSTLLLFFTSVPSQSVFLIFVFEVTDSTLCFFKELLWHVIVSFTFFIWFSRLSVFFQQCSWEMYVSSVSNFNYLDEEHFLENHVVFSHHVDPRTLPGIIHECTAINNQLSLFMNRKQEFIVFNFLEQQHFYCSHVALHAVVLWFYK